MNLRIFILSIFSTVIFTCLSYGQGTMEVYLKNNNTLSGLGVLKKEKIKITNDQGKTEKIKFEEIDSVKIYTKKGFQTLYFFRANKIRKYDYYKLESRGKVNVYSRSFKSLTSYGVFQSDFYYFKRDSEDIVTILGGGTVWDNFKKEAAEYFKDCPVLVDKIKKSVRGFTKKEKDQKNIARFYNSKCN